LLDEQIERSAQDSCEVSVGHGVAHQVACELELLFQGGVSRELDLVASGGEGFDDARSFCGANVRDIPNVWC
jgi:hypothetical protein